MTVLDRPDARRLPAEVRASLQRRLKVLSESLRNAPVTLSVPITVRVFTIDENDTQVAAGSGVSVRVDGFEVALTDSAGTAVVNVNDGDHLFAAASAINFGGSVMSTISSGQANPVDVVMGTGGDYSLAAALQIDEAADGVVPADFS